MAHKIEISNWKEQIKLFQQVFCDAHLGRMTSVPDTTTDDALPL